ncbi:MAG: right-handed parallel beta-helix repeat-containing protein [Phycisphaeraceae bacterium]|nr:right-handed parallel beta-helix repeat-containing protein [Phycisphaeraceae bacterium]
MNAKCFIGVVAFAAVVGVCAPLLLIPGAVAGPLNPPGGPIVPTAKPLTEVEPRIAINATNTPGDADSFFKITQPGSYYLTGNVIGVAGKHGIELAASNVTIDLNGFAVIGVAGSLSGVFRDTSVADAFVIRNGTVASWPAEGLDLNLGAPSTNRGARLESIIATQNGLSGFAVPDGAEVVGCVATRNGGVGFAMNNNAVLTNCLAQGNTGDGFSAGFGCTFLNCHARGNSQNGFIQNGQCAYSNCSATNNTVDGFVANRSSLVGCEAGFNQGVGFRITGSMLNACSAQNNNAGGMVATSSNFITQCLVQNGTVGLDVTGADNRIDGNNVVGASTGIRVTGAGNFIVRNSVSGGTMFSIVAGNSAGPIVTSAGMATLTNPMANFEY